MYVIAMQLRAMAREDSYGFIKDPSDQQEGWQEKAAIGS